MHARFWRPAGSGDGPAEFNAARGADRQARHQGRLIYVEGRLESRSFTDKDGKDREVTEVIASDVQFLDGPGAKRTDLPAEDRDDRAVEELDIPF